MKIRSFTLLGFAALIAAGCTSVQEAPTPAPAPIVADIVPVNNLVMALQTATELAAAGNPQTAIDRLTHAMGDPSITHAQRGQLLFERAKLRGSDTGFDTWGAISDLEEIMAEHLRNPISTDAGELLATMRGKATSLNFEAEQVETTRTRKAEILFELGDHEDALDLIRDFNLTPRNEIKLAMYQIGYLCDDPELTGREYRTVLTNGDVRQLHFCGDFK